jgi:hypothetical protein
MRFIYVEHMDQVLTRRWSSAAAAASNAEHCRAAQNAAKAAWPPAQKMGLGRRRR